MCKHWLEECPGRFPYRRYPGRRFSPLWQYPEVRASFSVDDAEEVTQWAVVLTK